MWRNRVRCTFKVQSVAVQVDRGRHHSHSFIRVELPVHGEGEPEQTPRFSVFPDYVTGVKVEREHPR